MRKLSIPFELNRREGILQVDYQPNSSPEVSGFDLFAGSGFDVNRCLGYPTMHAWFGTFAGTGYATACAWIQIITRREFASLETAEPDSVVVDVDCHPTLAELEVPFFAFGFPAEIYDAPCDNLGNLARLEWLADTFLVTQPTRVNQFTIQRIAGFCWGYQEYDLEGNRQVELKPLAVTESERWDHHLPLLRQQFGKWQYR